MDGANATRHTASDVCLAPVVGQFLHLLQPPVLVLSRALRFSGLKVDVVSMRWLPNNMNRTASLGRTVERIFRLHVQMGIGRHPLRPGRAGARPCLRAVGAAPKRVLPVAVVGGVASLGLLVAEVAGRRGGRVLGLAHEQAGRLGVGQQPLVHVRVEGVDAGVNASPREFSVRRSRFRPHWVQGRLRCGKPLRASVCGKVESPQEHIDRYFLSPTLLTESATLVRASFVPLARGVVDYTYEDLLCAARLRSRRLHIRWPSLCLARLWKPAFIINSASDLRRW